MELSRVRLIAPVMTHHAPSPSFNAPQLYIAMSQSLPRISPICFHQWDRNETAVRHLKSLSCRVRTGTWPQRRSDFGTCSTCPRNNMEVNGLGFKVLDSSKFRSHAKRSSSLWCQVEKESRRGRQLETDSGEVEALTFPAQLAIWVLSAVYVGWLFILPYAPGDPVLAISPATIKMLIDLSLNFFFVLPLTGYLVDFGVGIHGLAPVLHPVDESLFNFVIGWTLLFAPLLFTDRKRDRFGGSLEALWLVQMLLTNTVLGPYMAIRLNQVKASPTSVQTENPRENRLRSISEGLTGGAKYVALVGAAVGLLSLVWALYGRPEGGFGGVEERWAYLLQYISRERLAYAFVWDICLYSVFQPWLIGDNLCNVREESRRIVRVLRFVPYVGLVAYVLGLRQEVKNV